MGILVNVINSLLGYNDAKGVSQNPLQRAFDWERRYQSIPVENGTSDISTVEPGGQITIFDGTRTLPAPIIALSTTLSLTVLDSNKSMYRLKKTAGSGAFRVERPLSFTAATSVTFLVNNNALSTISVPNNTNGDFTNVSVGDTVRVRGALSGDLSNTVFSSANSGYWVVLAKATNNLSISVKRPPNQSFQGTNETVSIGSILTAEQLRIYSPTGVQKTDSFIIAGSFSPASHNNYSVNEVGPDFIDFVSGTSLPEEPSVVLQSADDLIVYSNAKKLIYIETDQNTAVRFNQDTSDNNLVQPIEVGTDVLAGYINKWGFTWKCVIVNKSQVNSATIKWICAE